VTPYLYSPRHIIPFLEAPPGLLPTLQWWLARSIWTILGNLYLSTPSLIVPYSYQLTLSGGVSISGWWRIPWGWYTDMFLLTLYPFSGFRIASPIGYLSVWLFPDEGESRGNLGGIYGGQCGACT